MLYSDDLPKNKKFTELRRLAEHVLASHPMEEERSSLREINRLLHELRVYQIELEMQNDELRRAQLEVARSRDRYVHLFDNAPVGFFTLNERGIVIEGNLTGSKMLGKEPGEIAGKSLSHFIHADDQDIFFRHRRQVFSSLLRQVNRIRFMGKEGSEIVTRMESLFLPLGEDEIPHCLTIVSDVTRQEKLEEALRHSQKMEALGTLTGGVAHEFNNELAIILGYAEDAQLMVPDNSKLAVNLQVIFDTVGRGKKIIQQLLKFSHQQPRVNIPINLLSVLHEIIILLKSSLPVNISLEVVGEDEAVHVTGDSVEIHQLVVNLCTNAAHAMQPRGGVIQIKVKTLRLVEPLSVFQGSLPAGGYVHLAVEDGGIGIAPLNMKRLFDPFFTTKEVGQGTGLGLSVVYGIVQGMGGGIVVESTLGKGSIFNVYLPKSRKNISSVAPVVSLLGNQGKGESLLLVEDEEEIAGLMKEMLERNGYHVTMFTNGDDALGVLLKDPDAFDLLITDLSMPKMSGKELIDQARVCKADLPILVCTGHDDTVIHWGEEAPVVRAVLTKPVSRHELLATIAGILAEKTV